MSTVSDIIDKYTEEDVIWEEDGLQFEQVISQVYSENNAVISAGVVRGHPEDTMYIRMERADDIVMVLVRPDEMASIAWCASGVLFSHELGKLLEDRDASKGKD